MSSRRFSTYFPAVFLIADLICFNGGFILAAGLKFGEFANLDNEYVSLLGLLNGLWLLVFFSSGLHVIHRELQLIDHLNKVLTALVINLAAVFALWFAIKPYYYSREHLFYTYLFFTIALILWRSTWHYFIRYYRSKGYNIRNVVILGCNTVSEDLENLFEVDRGYGYNFLGYFDDEVTGDKVKGKIEDFTQFAEDNAVDIVFCYLPKMGEDRMSDIINFAENNLVKVKIISHFSSLGLNNLAIQNYGSIPTINLTALPLDNKINQYVKRLFDVIFSSLVLLLILSWVIPIIGLLIKLESKGPVFFRQDRNGLNNQKFKIFKFRSMRVHDDSTVVQAKKGDTRVTKIGAILRKTSLDELPQFLNVFLGDMSVVGPRPHAVKHNEEFRKKIDRFIQRHAVKPGITGLAQAKGYRGETTNFSDISGRVKLDRFYVKNWSLILDFKIIVLTILSIVKGSENAY